MLQSHFAGGVSEQGDMQKADFKNWCNCTESRKHLIMPLHNEKAKGKLFR